jgi:hypothetical protein
LLKKPSLYPDLKKMILTRKTSRSLKSNTDSSVLPRERTIKNPIVNHLSNKQMEILVENTESNEEEVSQNPSNTERVDLIDSPSPQKHED